MANNPYVSVSQMGDFYDTRLIAQTLRDDNGTTLDTAAAIRLQVLLDDAASEVEAALRGAYAPPIYLAGTTTPAPAIARLVAALTIDRCFSRRGDVPKWVNAAREWYGTQIAEIVARRRALPGVAYASGPALQVVRQIEADSVVNQAVFMTLGEYSPEPNFP